MNSRNPTVAERTYLLEQKLKALGHDHRREMFLWLMEQPGEVERKMLQAAFPTSNANLTHHLKILRLAGLIDMDRLPRSKVIAVKILGVAELADGIARWVKELRRRSRPLAIRIGLTSRKNMRKWR